MNHADVLHQIDASEMTQTPWAYSYIPEFLSKSVAKSFLQDIRLASLKQYERDGEKKTYRLQTTDVLDCSLSENTRDWCLFFLSTAYRDAIAQLTGVDLEHSRVSISFWEYQAGDWLSPHLDKPEKLVNQIIYFNEDWDASYGGTFEVYDAFGQSVVTRILPEFASSLILVRSESSWHAVEPVRHCSRSRRSLSITFWRQ